MVFTHHDEDLNIDHRIAHQAVLTATRPMPGACVREIYAFEVLSSTEWRYAYRFAPDTYVGIEKSLSKKVEAMACYGSELREYPHPRSLEGIRLQARYRGLEVGMEAAEAFKSVRRIGLGRLV